MRDWLPQVINAIEPFLSSDIDAGARWQSEIAGELEKTEFGILCVTAENQQSPWLNFEAGALVKRVGVSLVVPLAIDLSPVEIQLPLAQFQAQPLTSVGMRKIVLTINFAAPSPLPDGRAEKAIDKWWPDLESEVERTQGQLSTHVTEEPARSDRELLEDILNTVRSLTREPGQPAEYQIVAPVTGQVLGESNRLVDAADAFIRAVSRYSEPEGGFLLRRGKQNNERRKKRPESPPVSDEDDVSLELSD